MPFSFEIIPKSQTGQVGDHLNSDNIKMEEGAKLGENRFTSYGNDL